MLDLKSCPNKPTVDIVRMVPKNTLVESLCIVILVCSLVQSCQVIGRCHGDGTVVRLIMLGLTARSLQRRFVTFLQENLTQLLQARAGNEAQTDD